MKRTAFSGAILALALAAMVPQAATSQQRMDREDVGAAIAAIIALGVGVAIATHGNNQNSGWDEEAYGQPFSPSPNVVCLPRPRQCFERSHYSARWTRRIFGS
jgi:hypothetical protein